MSVLIKGMEMPKNCYECPIRNQAYCGDGMKCGKTKEVISWHDGQFRRGDNCPLIPVQPHGRLIDADALMLEIQEYIEEYGWETDEHGWHNEKWCAMKEAAMAIESAPTVLEAEEGE